MRAIQEVRDELQRLHDEAVPLLVKAKEAKTKEDGLTEDEQKRFDEIIDRQADLETELNLIEKVDNYEERDKRFREVVGSGAEPLDPNALTRTQSEDEQRIFPSIATFLKSVQRSTTGQIDQPMTEYRTMLERRDIATGLQEDVGSEGGFLVPQTFINELMMKTHDAGAVAARCDPIPMTTKRVTWPAVHETSRADGSRWGGVRGYWEGEGETLTASRPKFREIALDAKKLTALVYATDELLEDATALSAFVGRVVPLEFAFKLDDAIINGDGGGKPMGVLNAPCLVSQAAETAQAATTIVFENLSKMRSRIFPRSLPRAVWFANSNVQTELQKAAVPVGTGGVPVWLPAGGIVGTPNDTLYGLPLIFIEQCQTLGTVGDIILGDFSQYLLGRKGNMQTATSIHVQFLTGQTVFRFVMRCDGQPWLQSALTPFTGGSSWTQSDFVALATRS